MSDLRKIVESSLAIQRLREVDDEDIARLNQKLIDALNSASRTDELLAAASENLERIKKRTSRVPVKALDQMSTDVNAVREKSGGVAEFVGRIVGLAGLFIGGYKFAKKK